MTHRTLKEILENIILQLNDEALNLTAFAKKHELDRFRLAKIRTGKVNPTIDEMDILIKALNL